MLAFSRMCNLRHARHALHTLGRETVQPMPGEVVIKQIIGDGILIVILGAIVAWLYRGPAPRLAQ